MFSVRIPSKRSTIKFEREDGSGYNYYNGGVQNNCELGIFEIRGASVRWRRVIVL